MKINDKSGVITYNASKSRYDEMKYNRSGNSGVLLPAISLGLWHNFGFVDNFMNGKCRSSRIGAHHLCGPACWR